MNNKTIIFLLLLLFPFTVKGMESMWVVKGDSAYTKGDYSAAVEAYQQALIHDGFSSNLFYNLGNSYAKGGDYGNALLYYLRATRLDPSNSRAKANIQYIENKVSEANRAELKGKKKSLEPDSPSFFSILKTKISSEHLSDTWAAWGVAFFLLFIVCVALYVFTSNVLLRKIGFFGGFVFIGIMLIALAFAFMSAGYHSNEGVLLGAKVKLRQEPSLSSKESNTALVRGTRMELLDSMPVNGVKAEWYKVRLNSDNVGWVVSSDFAPVEY